MTRYEFIEAMLDREGRVYAEPPKIDQPTAPGGITASMLSAYLGRTSTMEELRAVDVPYARVILGWWLDRESSRLKLGQIPYEPLRLQLLDFAWNSGEGEAIRYLQRAVGLTGGQADGLLGPRTLAALQRLPYRTVNNDVAARRAHAAYHGAVADRFAAGVAHRALEFVINNTD